MEMEDDDKIHSSGGFNIITLSDRVIHMPPNSETTLNVSLQSIKCETIEEYLEISAPFTKSHFIKLMGEVQKPRVKLNITKVNLGKIYAGVPEIID